MDLKKKPDIYHALLFQQAHYLRQHINFKLEARKKLKEEIKKEEDPEKNKFLKLKPNL